MTEEIKAENAVILIVDDTPQNIQVLGTILMAQKYQVSVATNGKQAIELAKKIRPDLILLDVMMPEMDGFEAAEVLRRSPETEEIPIIFLTAKNNPDDIVKGFNVGALDYVTKPFISEELLVRVRTQLRLKFALDQLKRRNQYLDHLVTIDGLTQLHNHEFIIDSLEDAVTNASINQTDLCLLMLDIDHFKSINDNYGHQFGDKVLIRISQEIRAVLRASDVAGRYGGEEFLVVLPFTSLNGAHITAERIRTTVESLEWPDHPDLRISISGGLCIWKGEDTTVFINRADELLYTAKRNGRNRLEVEH